MPKKFDTNPLDPDFPEKARSMAAGADTSPNSPYGPPPTGRQTPFKTAEFPNSPPSVTEEETRRFAGDDFQPYWQQAEPQPMAAYQPYPLADTSETSSRRVKKIGLPENLLLGLPYLPFHIGLVAGVIMLLLLPKDEARVRFHAAQGMAAHLGILIVTTVLGFLSNLTGLASVGNGIFQIVAFIMLIIFAIKAWRGKPVHIESVDDLTNWLEDKIGPVK